MPTIVARRSTLLPKFIRVDPVAAYRMISQRPKALTLVLEAVAPRAEQAANCWGDVFADDLLGLRRLGGRVHSRANTQEPLTLLST